jgi:AcrR family transcriptional regulator
MKPLSRAEQDEIRSRLLAAGKTLFSRLGIAKTTVRDICAEAGVPPGSFYLFFPSKDELYAEILVASVAEHRSGNSRVLSAFVSGDGAGAGSRPAGGGSRPAEASLGEFLSRMIAGIESDPILAQFHRRDSRLAAKRALVSARGGAAFAEISSGLDAVIAEWIASGLVAGEAKAVREVIQALIFLALNRSEIAGGAGRELVEAYTGFVAAGLARGLQSGGGGS